MFNRVISDISVVLRETTLTISDSIEAGLQVKMQKKKRVVPLSTTEITAIIRLKESDLQGRIPLIIINISNISSVNS